MKFISRGGENFRFEDAMGLARPRFIAKFGLKPAGAAP
jgi:hypothetical protein